MLRHALLGLGALLVCGTLAVGAQAQSPQDAAVALVRTIVRTGESACQIQPGSEYISVDSVSTANPPVVTVRARVTRFGPTGRQAFAIWEVSAGRAAPVSPLAAQISELCRPDTLQPTTAAQWRQLPYLDTASGGFDIVTNRSWFGGSPVAGIPGSAGSYSWGEPGATLWKPTCTKADQVLTLTRTVYLPGKPAALEIALRGVEYDSSRNWPNLFSRITLLVNGRVAYQTVSGGSGKLGPTALSAFVYGRNALELIAEKKPSAACNSGTKGLQLGVYMELSGTFAADLAVTGGIKSGLGACCQFQFGIANNGPSDALGLSLTFDIYTDLPDRIFGLVSSGSSWSCPIGTEASRSHWTMTCTTDRLAAGGQLPITILIGYHHPGGSFREGFQYSVRAASLLPDPVAGNELISKTGVTCSPPGSPGCP